MIREIGKESKELAKVIRSLLESVGTALEDGRFDPASDSVSVVLDVIKEIPNAISGVNLVDDEFKEAPALVSKMVLDEILMGVHFLLESLKKAKQNDDSSVE